MIQIVDSTKQQGEPVDNNKEGKPVDNKEGERKGVIGIIPTTSGLGHRQGKIYSYGEELPKFSQGFHPSMTQQEFNSIRYLNQSTTSRVANAIGQAGVGLVAMLGSGIGYIADIPDLVRRANGYEGEVGNWLSDLMDNMREDYQEYAPINVENADMHGPRFSAGWFLKNFPTIVESASLFIPGAGAAGVLSKIGSIGRAAARLAKLSKIPLTEAGKLAKAQRLKNIDTITRTVSSSVANTMIAGMMNSAETMESNYQMYLDRGYDEKTALAAASADASRTFNANMWAIVPNLIQSAFIFSPRISGFTKALGENNKAVKAVSNFFNSQLGKVGVSTLTEMYEEGYEYAITKSASLYDNVGDMVRDGLGSIVSKDYWSDPEYQNSVMLGALGGGLTQAVIGGYESYKEGKRDPNAAQTALEAARKAIQNGESFIDPPLDPKNELQYFNMFQNLAKKAGALTRWNFDKANAAYRGFAAGNVFKGLSVHERASNYLAVTDPEKHQEMIYEAENSENSKDENVLGAVVREKRRAESVKRLRSQAQEMAAKHGVTEDQALYYLLNNESLNNINEEIKNELTKFIAMNPNSQMTPELFDLLVKKIVDKKQLTEEEQKKAVMPEDGYSNEYKRLIKAAAKASLERKNASETEKKLNDKNTTPEQAKKLIEKYEDEDFNDEINEVKDLLDKANSVKELDNMLKNYGEDYPNKRTSGVALQLINEKLNKKIREEAGEISPTLPSMPALDELKDEELENYEKDGTVTDERIASIAGKEVRGEELTDLEKQIASKEREKIHKKKLDEISKGDDRKVPDKDGNLIPINEAREQAINEAVAESVKEYNLLAEQIKELKDKLPKAGFINKIRFKKKIKELEALQKENKLLKEQLEHFLKKADLFDTDTVADLDDYLKANKEAIDILNERLKYFYGQKKSAQVQNQVLDDLIKALKSVKGNSQILKIYDIIKSFTDNYNVKIITVNDVQWNKLFPNANKDVVAGTVTKPDGINVVVVKDSFYNKAVLGSTYPTRTVTKTKTTTKVKGQIDFESKISELEQKLEDLKDEMSAGKEVFDFMDNFLKEAENDVNASMTELQSQIKTIKETLQTKGKRKTTKGRLAEKRIEELKNDITSETRSTVELIKRVQELKEKQEQLKKVEQDINEQIEFYKDLKKQGITTKAQIDEKSKKLEAKRNTLTKLLEKLSNALKAALNVLQDLIQEKFAGAELLRDFVKETGFDFKSTEQLEELMQSEEGLQELSDYNELKDVVEDMQDEFDEVLTKISNQEELVEKLQKEREREDINKKIDEIDKTLRYLKDLEDSVIGQDETITETEEFIETDLGSKTTAFDSQQLSEFGQLLIHELTHAATNNLIDRIKNHLEKGTPLGNITQEQVDAYKRLEGLMDEVRKQFPDYENDPDLAYGMQNVKEFLSELSNKQFSAKLQKVKFSLKDFLKKIFGEIATLLNMKDKQTTAYREAHDILKTMMSSDAFINDVIAGNTWNQGGASTSAGTKTDIEAKKADIERRRQEANTNQLKEIGSNKFLKKNKKGENTELSAVELKLINSLIDKMIKQGKTAKEINVDLNSRGFVQSLATTPAQIETYLQSRIDGKISAKVGESITEEINAKYDAELKALGQSSTTQTQQPPSQKSNVAWNQGTTEDIISAIEPEGKTNKVLDGNKGRVITENDNIDSIAYVPNDFINFLIKNGIITVEKFTALMSDSKKIEDFKSSYLDYVKDIILSKLPKNLDKSSRTDILLEQLDFHAERVERLLNSVEDSSLLARWLTSEALKNDLGRESNIAKKQRELLVNKKAKLDKEIKELDEKIEQTTKEIDKLTKDNETLGKELERLNMIDKLVTKTLQARLIQENISRTSRQMRRNYLREDLDASPKKIMPNPSSYKTAEEFIAAVRGLGVTLPFINNKNAEGQYDKVTDEQLTNFFNTTSANLTLIPNKTYVIGGRRYKFINQYGYTEYVFEGENGKFYKLHINQIIGDIELPAPELPIPSNKKPPINPNSPPPPPEEKIKALFKKGDEVIYMAEAYVIDKVNKDGTYEITKSEDENVSLSSIAETELTEPVVEEKPVEEKKKPAEEVPVEEVPVEEIVPTEENEEAGDSEIPIDEPPFGVPLSKRKEWIDSKKDPRKNTGAMAIAPAYEGKVVYLGNDTNKASLANKENTVNLDDYLRSFLEDKGLVPSDNPYDAFRKYKNSKKLLREFKSAVNALMPDYFVHTSNPLAAKYGFVDNAIITDKEPTAIKNRITKTTDEVLAVKSNESVEDIVSAVNLEEAQYNPSVIPQQEYTLEQQQMVDSLREILPDGVTIELFDNLLQNSSFELFGMVKDSYLALANKGPKDYQFHEAFHIVFNNVLTPQEQSSTYDALETLEQPTEKQIEIADKYLREQRARGARINITPYQYAQQELLAEMFRSYMGSNAFKRTLNRISREIGKAFNKLLKMFNLFDGNPNAASDIYDLFRKIRRGDMRNRTIIKTNSSVAYAMLANDGKSPELSTSEIMQLRNSLSNVIENLIETSYRLENEEVDDYSSKKGEAFNKNLVDNIEENIITSINRKDGLIRKMLTSLYLSNKNTKKPLIEGESWQLIKPNIYPKHNSLVQEATNKDALERLSEVIDIETDKVHYEVLVEDNRRFSNAHKGTLPIYAVVYKKTSEGMYKYLLGEVKFSETSDLKGLNNTSLRVLREELWDRYQAWKVSTKPNKSTVIRSKNFSTISSVISDQPIVTITTSNPASVNSKSVKEELGQPYFMGVLMNDNEIATNIPLPSGVTVINPVIKGQQIGTKYMLIKRPDGKYQWTSLLNNRLKEDQALYNEVSTIIKEAYDAYWVNNDVSLTPFVERMNEIVYHNQRENEMYPLNQELFKNEKFFSNGAFSVSKYMKTVLADKFLQIDAKQINIGDYNERVSNRVFTFIKKYKHFEEPRITLTGYPYEDQEAPLTENAEIDKNNFLRVLQQIRPDITGFSLIEEEGQKVIDIQTSGEARKGSLYDDLLLSLSDSGIKIDGSKLFRDTQETDYNETSVLEDESVEDEATITEEEMVSEDYTLTVSISRANSLTNEAKALLRKVPRYQGKEVKRDMLGFPMFYTAVEMYGKLQFYLGNSTDIDDMMNKLYTASRRDLAAAYLLKHIQKNPTATFKPKGKSFKISYNSKDATLLFAGIGNKNYKRSKSSIVNTVSIDHDDGYRYVQNTAKVINDDRSTLQMSVEAELNDSFNLAAYNKNATLRENFERMFSNVPVSVLESLDKEPGLKNLFEAAVNKFSDKNSETYNNFGLSFNKVIQRLINLYPNEYQNGYLTIDGKRKFSWDRGNFLDKLQHMSQNPEKMKAYFGYDDTLANLPIMETPLEFIYDGGVKNFKTKYYVFPKTINLVKTIEAETKIGVPFSKFSDNDMLFSMFTKFRTELKKEGENNTGNVHVPLFIFSDAPTHVYLRAPYLSRVKAMEIAKKMFVREKEVIAQVSRPETKKSRLQEVTRFVDLEGNPVNTVEEYFQLQYVSLVNALKEAGILRFNTEPFPQGLTVAAYHKYMRDIKSNYLQIYDNYLDINHDILTDFILNYVAYDAQLSLITIGDYGFYPNAAAILKRAKEVISPSDKGNAEVVIDLKDSVTGANTVQVIGVHKDGGASVNSKNMVIKVIDDFEIDSPIGLASKANLTDGQSFIDPLAWRNRTITIGKPWNRKQEEEFQKLINGEVSNLTLTPFKPFVFGFRNVEGTATPVQKKDSEHIMSPYYGRQYVNGTENTFYNEFYKNVLEGMGYVFETDEKTKNTKVTLDLSKRNFDVLSFDSAIKVGRVPGENIVMPYSEWGFQQETPEHHKDTDGNVGVQFVKHISSSLKEEGTYTIRNRAGKSIKELSPQQYYEEFSKLIMEKANLNEMPLNEQELRKVVLEELIDKGYTATTIRALSKLPLWFPTNNRKVESAILSKIRNSINKITFTGGGSLVNVSAIGFSNLSIVKDPETGGVKYLEALAPITDSRLTKFIDPRTGAIPRDKATMAAIEREFPGALDMIVYRIPTEDKYSIFPVKIVGFLPMNESSIMLPPDVTTLAGLDFDIDKMMFLRRTTRLVDMEQRMRDRNNGELTDKNVKFLENAKIDNKLFDLMYSVLQDEHTAKAMLNPGSFQDIKDIATKFEEPRKFVAGYLSELVAMGQATQAGKRLVGIYASTSADHSNKQHSNIVDTHPFRLIIGDEEFTFSALNKQHNLAGERITKLYGSRVGMATDNAKDTVADLYNSNIVTSPVESYLISVGVPQEIAMLFISQPVIKEYVKEFRNIGGRGEQYNSMLYKMKSEVLKLKNPPDEISYIFRNYRISDVIDSTNTMRVFSVDELLDMQKGIYKSENDRIELLWAFLTIQEKANKNFKVNEILRRADNGLSYSVPHSYYYIRQFDKILNYPTFKGISEYFYDKSPNYTRELIAKSVFEAFDKLYEVYKGFDLRTPQANRMLDYLEILLRRDLSKKDIEDFYNYAYIWAVTNTDVFADSETFDLDSLEELQKAYPDNLFLQRLRVRDFSITLKSPYSNEATEESVLRDSFTELYEKDKATAIKLIKYAIKEYGFSMKKNGFGHLIPDVFFIDNFETVKQIEENINKLTSSYKHQQNFLTNYILSNLDDLIPKVNSDFKVVKLVDDRILYKFDYDLGLLAKIMHKKTKVSLEYLFTLTDEKGESSVYYKPLTLWDKDKALLKSSGKIIDGSKKGEKRLTSKMEPKVASSTVEMTDMSGMTDSEKIKTLKNFKGVTMQFTKAGENNFTIGDKRFRKVIAFPLLADNISSKQATEIVHSVLSKLKASRAFTKNNLMLDKSFLNIYDKLRKAPNTKTAANDLRMFVMMNYNYDLDKKSLLENVMDLTPVLESEGEKQISYVNSLFTEGSEITTMYNIEEFYKREQEREEAGVSATKDIITNTNKKLNLQQVKAYEEIMKFVREGNSNEWFMLEGKAGTGKSTVISAVLKEFVGNNKNENLVMSYTHAAKDNIADMIDSENLKAKVTTLHAGIGITPSNSIPKNSTPIQRAKIIFIDEASMVDNKMLEMIMTYKDKNTKVIFSGDSGQLSLEGVDDTSPTFATENKAVLTDRVRQGEGHPLLDYSDVLWNETQKENPRKFIPELDTLSVNKENELGEIVFSESMTDVLNSTKDLFKRSVEEQDFNLIRAIVYRNKTRNRLNKIIRNSIFGENAKEYEVGDMLIAFENSYVRTDEGKFYSKFFNGQKMIVKKVNEITETVEIPQVIEAGNGMFQFDSPKNMELKFFELVVDFYNSNGIPINTEIIKIPARNDNTNNRYKDSNSSYNTFQQEIEKLNSIKWRMKRSGSNLFDVLEEKIDSLKENIDNVDYAYVLTSHKSQGQTVENVIVYESDIDSVDVLSNREINRSKYTAVTRAKKRAYIVTNRKQQLAQNITLESMYAMFDKFAKNNPSVQGYEKVASTIIGYDLAEIEMLDYYREYRRTITLDVKQGTREDLNNFKSFMSNKLIEEKPRIRVADFKEFKAFGAEETKVNKAFKAYALEKMNIKKWRVTSLADYDLYLDEERKDSRERMNAIYEQAAKNLDRPIMDEATPAGRMARLHYLEINNANALYAFGDILWKDNEKNTSGKAMVDSPISYQVEMAIMLNKPVYVFNVDENKWYFWNGFNFIKTGIPSLSSSFAVAGSEGLTIRTEEAIRDLFRNTLVQGTAIKEKPFILSTGEDIYIGLPEVTKTGKTSIGGNVFISEDFKNKGVPYPPTSIGTIYKQMKSLKKDFLLAHNLYKNLSLEENLRRGIVVNPFEMAGRTDEVAASMYANWILGLDHQNISPIYRQSLVDSFRKGDYKNTAILTYTEKGKATYANMLDYFINKHNWNVEQEFEVTPKPSTQPTAKVNPLVEAGIKPTDLFGNAWYDIEMASEATQFIGFGTIMKKGNISFTDKLARAWGAKANTGVYTADDVIMVSGSGNFGRGGVDKKVEAEAIRKTLTEKYKPLLNKAIAAGASFRVGNQYSKGNLSDELIAKYLKAKGYIEEELTGYSRWTPPSVQPSTTQQPIIQQESNSIINRTDRFILKQGSIVQLLKDKEEIFIGWNNEDKMVMSDFEGNVRTVNLDDKKSQMFDPNKMNLRGSVPIVQNNQSKFIVTPNRSVISLDTLNRVWDHKPDVKNKLYLKSLVKANTDIKAIRELTYEQLKKMSLEGIWSNFEYVLRVKFGEDFTFDDFKEYADSFDSKDVLVQYLKTCI